MTTEEAYAIVFDDMTSSGCGLLVGRYDAQNGKKDFMYGVAMVMEYIAYKVSDSVGDTFSDLFTKNMIQSKKKWLW